MQQAFPWIQHRANGNTYPGMRAVALELPTTHLKMDFIVEFYMTFLHNSEESSKINPSHNFGNAT